MVHQRRIRLVLRNPADDTRFARFREELGRTECRGPCREYTRARQGLLRGGRVAQAIAQENAVQIVDREATALVGGGHHRPPHEVDRRRAANERARRAHLARLFPGTA